MKKDSIEQVAVESEITSDLRAAIKKKKEHLQTDNLFLIFDMGVGVQYLVREIEDHFGFPTVLCNPKTIRADEVDILQPSGIIISDGDKSISLPYFDREIFQLEIPASASSGGEMRHIPILGIGVGQMIIADFLNVEEIREERVGDLMEIDLQSPLFRGCTKEDKILQRLPPRLKCNNTITFQTAKTSTTLGVAGLESSHLYGIDFAIHAPETTCGETILSNFIYRICLGLYNDKIPKIESDQKAFAPKVQAA